MTKQNDTSLLRQDSFRKNRGKWNGGSKPDSSFDRAALHRPLLTTNENNPAHLDAHESPDTRVYRAPSSLSDIDYNTMSSSGGSMVSSYNSHNSRGTYHTHDTPSVVSSNYLSMDSAVSSDVIEDAAELPGDATYRTIYQASYELA